VTESLISCVNWFRQASPYIRKHQGKTALIMLPGEFCHDDQLSRVINDLAVLNSLGVKLVIVHGARQQVETQLNSTQMSSKFHNGIRITPHEHIQEILKAVGALRTKIEAAFSSGLPNSPMYGSRVKIRSGNFVSARPRGVRDGIDYQLTGEVRSVDKHGIHEALKNDNLVLISPLGYSLTGEVFNLSFAEVAVEVASSIQADKLIAYNDDGQIRDANGTHYREMTLLKCATFLVEKQLHRQSNTYFSLQACHQACDKGVARAHIVSAHEDGAILKELYTRDGSGTMVYRDNYETIRTATIDDVAGVLELIAPLESDGTLVKRSRERLETEIDHFTVMEKDNLVLGCAALYPIEGQEAGEVACVAIHNDYRKGGRAQNLLKHLEVQAAKLKLKELFVLTTQTAHWFIEQGFNECDLQRLPAERQMMYNNQRQSKIFVKAVNPDKHPYSSLKNPNQEPV
jgi:amino-acid N-acetyltransferase